MTRIVTAAVVLVATLALASPSLFISKVPYDPLVGKLKASGGDSSRIVRVRSAQDLARLESGKRYKFALDPSDALSIAPLPADAPNNEYVHPILAGGGPVRTAGGIDVEHDGGKITKITIDQDSKAFCPTLQSLDEVARVLKKLGVTPELIVRQDRAPKCAAQ